MWFYLGFAAFAVFGVFVGSTPKDQPAKANPISAAVTAAILAIPWFIFWGPPLSETARLEREARRLEGEIAALDRVQAAPMRGPTGAAPAEAGAPLRIPSDPRADYLVLALSKRPDGYMFIRTRRAGPSGLSYSEAAIDCVNWLSATIREGERLDEMLAREERTLQFGTLVEGSISDVKARYACAAA